MVSSQLSFVVLKNLPPRYKKPTITVRTWGLKQDGEGTVLAEVREFKYEERLGVDRCIFFFDMGDIEVVRETKSGCLLHFCSAIFSSSDQLTTNSLSPPSESPKSASRTLGSGFAVFGSIQ